MSIAVAEMVAGSMAANPKAWSCSGCSSLFVRPAATTMHCGHPGLAMPWAARGRDLEGTGRQAAPHWCPRTTAPVMPA